MRRFVRGGAAAHVDHISADQLEKARIKLTTCRRCATSVTPRKGNRDDTDFLLWRKRLQFRKPGCAMCADGTHELGNNLAYCVLAGTDDSSMVVPRRHAPSFMDLMPSERNLCIELAESRCAVLEGAARARDRF